MRAALLMALALVGASGCAGPPEAPAAASPAVPSTDELCAEHGVLEAVCPKCNPKLAPVFQAKGDWCAEHGFPESFCPICRPERGGRPATEVASADEPPPDRLRVRLLSPETSRVAGIVTEKGRSADVAATLVLPAKLAYDSAKRAEVNARSAGIVHAVAVDVGSPVAKGAPLVVVDSPEVGADRSRLLAAQTRVEVAQARLERERALYAERMTAQREVQEAESELAAALGEVRALEAAAGVVGAGEPSGRYTLFAPIAGVVVRRTASLGRRVDPEEILLEIVDASTLWAEIDVPERHLAEVRVGSAVTLTFDALGGVEAHGTIASVAPEVDPKTRTAVARVKVANPDGALRANMYGRARIAKGGGAAGVSVPRTALQRANGAEVVFVRITDALYETRRVETGARGDGWVQVLRGIAPGEDVVTVGSFLLKTETLKGSIGAGCCEVE